MLFGTPGPAVIALLASGIQFGFTKTLPFLSGIYFGYLINLFISTSFVAGAFYLSDATLFFFKIIASSYILYLAYKIALSPVISKDNIAKPKLQTWCLTEFNQS